MGATIVDPSALTTSDYQLTYDGGNNYTLTRLSDNTTTAIDTLGGSPFVTSSIDGMTLTITAGSTAGDEFIIRPTINGASGLGLNISEASKVAAAAPFACCRRGRRQRHTE